MNDNFCLYPWETSLLYRNNISIPHTSDYQDYVIVIRFFNSRSSANKLWMCCFDKEDFYSIDSDNIENKSVVTTCVSEEEVLENLSSEGFESCLFFNSKFYDRDFDICLKKIKDKIEELDRDKIEELDGIDLPWYNAG